jgi:hypothetical protein
MADEIPPELRAPDTPDDVVIQLTAPEPMTDPTLGVALAAQGPSRARHRLVTLGDSLTHGFQSFAIFNTDVSYPAIIAAELGSYDEFVHPEYREFGGLPLNLEYLVRELESRFGAEIRWWELPAAGLLLYHASDRICEYWERGPGSLVPQAPGIMRNLAVSGYDVRDLMARTADTERRRMQVLPPTLVHLVARNAGPLMGRYVLESARDDQGSALTPVEAAAALGQEGGIETLIVFIGANNALGGVTELKVRWSGDDYADPDLKSQYTVWRPSHFEAEMRALMAQVRGVKAEHVIWATVPHVTIVPVARGIGAKMYPGSRYFPYYTRPWIAEDKFDPGEDPCVTGNQARAIDSAIDQYNDVIANGVVEARQAGLDWLLLDTCGLMDRLASRRYILDPAARPDWWTPYQLPPVLAELNPPPDSRYLATSSLGRTAGGLFSLDGVHPTTIAYGLIAQEFMNVMAGAGVVFDDGDGRPRQAPVQIDFAGLLARDTLLTDPPKAVTPDLRWLGWADELLDWASRLRRVFTGP